MLHSFQPPQVHSPAHGARRTSTEVGADVAALSQQMGSVVAVCILSLCADLQGVGRAALALSINHLLNDAGAALQ